MSDEENRVVVTGVGVVSAIGLTVDSFWNSLLAGKSGAKEWEDLKVEGFRSTTACRIPDFLSDPLHRGRAMYADAVAQALDMAKALPPDDTGVFVGSTIGESAAFEEAAKAKIHNLVDYSCFSFGTSVKKHYKLNGPVRAYGTACTAGNYAIGSAARMLRKGNIKMAIAGGVDPFSRIAMAGFSRSRAMTSKGVCRPFDEHRSGMLLGEGSAVLILELEKDALARAAKPLAVIGALGLSCDAHHATAPEREGRQMTIAFERALTQQGIRADEVDWICAHGSGTKISDQVEAKSICKVFGEHSLPVTAIKGATGHSLGAATALETVACVMGLQHHMIPPTTNLTKPAADLLIDVVATPTPTHATWVLNCGYAFGGLNSALLIGSWN